MKLQNLIHIVIGIVCIGFLPGAKAVVPTTFTVTSTADTDGSVCGAGCTLRQAINASNANPPPPNTTNLIAFNIDPGDPNNNCDLTSDVCTITPTNSPTWPHILRPVTIDGYTQLGASPNTLTVGDNAALKIRIDGVNFNPLFFFENRNTDSSGSTIKGLVIINATGNWIFIESNNNKIAGNFLGVDFDGSTQSGSGTPVEIIADAGRLVTGNVIGGTAPEDRNIIAPAGGFGIEVNGFVSPGASASVVQGNYIGTNAAGTSHLPVSQGVRLIQNTPNSLIGGTASGAGNVIAADFGIAFDNSAGGSVIQGNLIGTDATGTVGFGGFHGIQGSSPNIMIGGTDPGAGNLISSYDVGIMFVGGTGWIIQGNRIGTDITGTMPIGNGCNGIVANNSGGNPTGAIGGAGPGEGNIIAFSGTQGVELGNGSTFTILGNSIFGNGGYGIALNNLRCDLALQPSLNDHCDSDIGANNGQNYPVITSASFSGGFVTLSGTLDSVSVPHTTFRIEFFSNSECDLSTNGQPRPQGRTFLGSTNVTTGDCPADPNQPNASFGGLTFALPTGHTFVTATATRLDGGGNPIETSEFSACVTVGGAPTPTPTPTASPSATPTPTPTPTCTPSQFHVLIVYSDTLPPTQLQSQILAEPGVTTVDLFNAASSTPTLGQLQQYQIVVPLSNIGAPPGFLDATTLGNNLADYVDGGGVVVQYGFTFYGPSQSHGVNGRWVTVGARL